MLMNYIFSEEEIVDHALGPGCKGNEDNIIPVADTLEHISLNETGYDIIRNLFLKFQGSLTDYEIARLISTRGKEAITKAFCTILEKHVEKMREDQREVELLNRWRVTFYSPTLPTLN